MNVRPHTVPPALVGGSLGAHAFVYPSESGGARRFATPVEPALSAPFVFVPLFLTLKPFASKSP